MAIDSAKALVAKIATDAEVAKEFAAVKDAESFAKAAAKYGYNCTIEEFKEARDNVVESKELSDEEVNQLSGGLSIVGVDYTVVVAQEVS